MDVEHSTNGASTATRSRTSSGNGGCIRKLILALVLVFVLLMVIFSIVWFVMDIQEPNFQVTSFSVSNFSVSTTQLRGKYQVELAISNPNKKIEVMLDHFNVLVYYGQVGLSVAAMKPVYLEKLANKTVVVSLVVRDSPRFVRKEVPENMVKEWNKGVVNFDVRMVVTARFEAGILPSKEKFLDVFCGDLDVGFFSPKDSGKLLGIGKHCHDAEEDID
ncbi:uncharacterized protein LOC107477673 [Arachis duranensis]|uniref:Uncharacterized protein LOC107477673 n=1 Tax=Arachis duranensis TaxID=130453 RepID=A0A6P4CKX3_ARADU|nr:uncharacterized protein LOC107477673 [Arachis duranensis]